MNQQQLESQLNSLRVNHKALQQSYEMAISKGEDTSAHQVELARLVAQINVLKEMIAEIPKEPFSLTG